MDDTVSEVASTPEMESSKATDSGLFNHFVLREILDEDAIWVSFGVGGPA